MKRLLIAFLLICAFACKKSRDEKVSLLVGSWELRKSEDGVAGTINFPPGNGNIQQYHKDGSFEYYQDSLKIHMGTYELTQISGRNEWLLTIHSQVYGAVWTDTILLSIDKFVTKRQEACCDFPTYTYSRIGEL